MHDLNVLSTTTTSLLRLLPEHLLLSYGQDMHDLNVLSTTTTSLLRLLPEHLLLSYGQDMHDLNVLSTTTTSLDYYQNIFYLAMAKTCMT